LEKFCRLPEMSKETKEILEKHGKKTLGQGGYVKIK
jgi:hypothetical protein